MCWCITLSTVEDRCWYHHPFWDLAERPPTLYIEYLKNSSICRRFFLKIKSDLPRNKWFTIRFWSERVRRRSLMSKCDVIFRLKPKWQIMLIQFFFQSTIIYSPPQVGDLHDFVEKYCWFLDICTTSNLYFYRLQGAPSMCGCTLAFSSFEQVSH